MGKTFLVSEFYKCISGRNRDERRPELITLHFNRFDCDLPFAALVSGCRELISNLLGRDEKELSFIRQQLIGAIEANGRLLAELVPEMKSLLGESTMPAGLSSLCSQQLLPKAFQHFFCAIAQKNRPLIIWLEDLQWADRPTLDLLESFVSASRQEYLLVIGSYRESEVNDNHPVCRAIANIRKSKLPVQTISLGSLPHSQMNQIMADGSAGLHGLEKNYKDLLQQAACTGFVFDLDLLSVLRHQAVASLYQQFREPRFQDFVLPLQHAASENETACNAIYWRFASAEMHHLVYSAIDEHQKKEWHGKIGQKLLARADSVPHYMVLVSAAKQMLLGPLSFEAQTEIAQGIELLIKAGNLALSLGIEEFALTCFKAGMGMLPENNWRVLYSLSKRLYLGAAESAGRCQSHEQAHGFLDVFLQNVQALEDEAQACQIRLFILSLQHKPGEALAAGCAILKKLGVKIAENPSNLADRFSLAMAKKLLFRKQIDDFAYLPEMSNPIQLAAMAIMDRLCTILPASFHGVLRQLEIKQTVASIQYGLSPFAARAFVNFGRLLCEQNQDLENGYAFGRVALLVSEKAKEVMPAITVRRIYESHLHHLQAPLQHTLAPLQKIYQLASGLENHEEADLALQAYLVHQLFSGTRLSNIEKELISFQTASPWLKTATNGIRYDLVLQFINNLKGSTLTPCDLIGEAFDERIIPAQHLAGMDGSIGSLFYFLKLVLACLFQDYENAHQLALILEKKMDSSISSFFLPLGYYFCALARLARYTRPNSPQRRKIRKEVTAILRKLSPWTKVGPDNHLHRYCFLEAELANLSDNIDKAGRLYDQAAQSAQKSGFLLDEALISERAAQFWEGRQQKDFARLYLIKALYAFQQLQAESKVEKLIQQHHEWLTPSAADQYVLKRMTAEPAQQTISLSEKLDFASVMKALEVISSEIVLSELLKKMLTIVIENMGGQKGVLLLAKDGQWFIEAHGNTSKNLEPVLECIPFAENHPKIHELLPTTIINYVIRTHENMVIENAAQDNRFATDPYISRSGTKSILCNPIFHQDSLSTIIYLENNLISGAFSSDRLEYLRALATPFAISLENARLYESLAASEKRVRTLLTTANEGFVEMDQGGFIMDVNPKMSDILGRPSNAIIGRSISDFVEPDKQEEMLKQLKHQKPKGKNSYEVTFKQPDQCDVHCQFNTSPLLEGEHTIGTFAMVTDITQRILAERALKESEERFRKLSDVAEEGIAIYSKHRIIDGNEALARIFGYEHHEMIGIEVFQLVRPESRESLAHHIRYGFNKPFLDMGVRKDGSRFHVQVIGKPYHYHGKDLLVGAVRDITNLKKAEEEIHKLNAELEKRVLERTTELNLVNEQLKESIRQAKQSAHEAQSATKAKSDFLARMSHEIRTPMNAIIGLSHLALQGRLAPRQEDFLQKIQSSAQSLLEIINDILDFSKIEAGKMQIESIEFHLEDVLRSLSNLMSIKVEEKGLELFFDTRGDVPLQLIGDPARLGQILINLTNNAVKFTSQGEIVVKTELIKKQRAGVELCFTVGDTGIGLSKNEMDNLFQSFIQADGTITRKYGGTGLGLAICKRLVEMMGGKIHVESEPGKGSRFIFTVPFGRQSKEGQEICKPALDLHESGILVVDDSITSCAILQTALQSLSSQVSTALSGKAALAKIAEHSHRQAKAFDLIIIDYQMPDWNGIETAERIQQLVGKTSIPIMIMTPDSGREKIIQAAGEIGIEFFLTKPINRSDLYSAIMAGLGRKKMDPAVQMKKQFINKEILLQTSGATIMLVEDDRVNQLVATEFLNKAGIAVVTADNGQEAVQVLTSRQDLFFEAILMDLHMPEMDGYEASRIIRNNPRFRNVPIIAMTADAITGIRENCLAAGMNDFVAKPIDPEYFYKTIVKWISKSHKNIIDHGVEYTEEQPGLADDYHFRRQELAPRLEASSALQDPVTDAPIDRIMVETMLRRLVDMMKENDMEAIEYFEELRPHLLITQFKSLLGRIKNQLSRYDYPNALNNIKEIAGQLGIILEEKKDE